MSSIARTTVETFGGIEVQFIGGCALAEQASRDYLDFLTRAKNRPADYNAQMLSAVEVNIGLAIDGGYAESDLDEEMYAHRCYFAERFLKDIRVGFEMTAIWKLEMACDLAAQRKRK